jgi:hypothetical protein
MIVSFLVLFPSAAVRTFYALELPKHVLGSTIGIGLAGIAMLIATTALLRRFGHGPSAAAQARQ